MNLLRHILTPVVLVISLLFAGRASANDIFEQLSTDFGPSVESTYISGRYASTFSRWKSSHSSESVTLGKSFTSMYTYNLSSTESVAKAEELLKKHLKGHPDMKLTMSKKKGDSVYNIYEDRHSGDKLFQMIIWNRVAANCAELAIINWKGGLGGSDSAKVGSSRKRNRVNPLAGAGVYSQDSDGNLSEITDSLADEIRERTLEMLENLDLSSADYSLNYDKIQKLAKKAATEKEND